MDLINFDLLLSDDPPTAQVVKSDWAPGGSEEVKLKVNVKQLIKDFDRLVGNPSTTDKAIQKYGARLFKSVFVDGVRTVFDRSMGKSDPGSLFRIRLRFNGPRLASLPWELLYNKTEEFISMNEGLTLSRFRQIGMPEPLKMELPLRILVVSCTGPKGFPELKHEQEHKNIEEALDDRKQSGDVDLEPIHSATRDDVETALQRSDFHVLHFIGHGDFEKEQNVVYFENGTDEGDAINAIDLANIASHCQSLRLIVLNACSTGKEQLRGSHKIFSSMAGQLVGHGVPAIVAMQTPIADQVAIRFSEAFYGQLAADHPIDRAITKARKLMQNSRYAPTWAFCIPVLYMQRLDGKIFDLSDSSRRHMISALEQVKQLKYNSVALAESKELHEILQVAVKDVDRAYSYSQNHKGDELLKDIWKDVGRRLKGKLLPFMKTRSPLGVNGEPGFDDPSEQDGWFSSAISMHERVRGRISGPNAKAAVGLPKEIRGLLKLLRRHWRDSNRSMIDIQEDNKLVYFQFNEDYSKLKGGNGAIALDWAGIADSMDELNEVFSRMDEWLGLHECYDRLDSMIHEFSAIASSDAGIEIVIDSWNNLRLYPIRELLEIVGDIKLIGDAHKDLEDGPEKWAFDIKDASDEVDRLLENLNLEDSMAAVEELEEEVKAHYAEVDTNVKNEVKRLDQSRENLHLGLI